MKEHLTLKIQGATPRAVSGRTVLMLVRVTRSVPPFAAVALAILITVACRRNDPAPFPVKKASAIVPTNARSISGSYYRGDGTGYNIHLTLKSEGSYTAEWHGCLGKYGDARGTWRLNGSRIMFSPSSETDMMQGHLRTLDVMRFEGDWVFLPTSKEDREFYEKWGVSSYSCFQKKDRQK